MLDFQIRYSSSPFWNAKPTYAYRNWSKQGNLSQDRWDPAEVKTCYVPIASYTRYFPSLKKIETVGRHLRNTVLQMTEWTRGEFLFLFFLFLAETLTRHFTVRVYFPDKWMGAWTIWFSVGLPWLLYLCKACARETTAYHTCTACSFPGPLCQKCKSVRLKWQFILQLQCLPFLACIVKCVMPAHLKSRPIVLVLFFIACIYNFCLHICTYYTFPMCYNHNQ